MYLEKMARRSTIMSIFTKVNSLIHPFALREIRTRNHEL